MARVLEHWRRWSGDPVSNPNGPLDHDLLLLCAIDPVKLLRNHRSLALWVGENEQVPPDDINKALKNDLRLHPYFENSNEISKSFEDLSVVSKDPSQYFDGKRVYIQGSLWDGFANVRGLHWWPLWNPKSWSIFKNDFYSHGFNPEVGSIGMVVAYTIRATMSQEG